MSDDKPTITIEHEEEDLYAITDIENWETTEEDPNRIYLRKKQLHELYYLLEKELY